MKLTTNQINQIDETLVLNNVVYDDIKLELTDHIASDIEQIMTDEKLPYEEAFKEAFDKWEEQLKPSKDRIFRFQKINPPTLAWDKLMGNINKQILYSALLSILITSSLLGLIKISDKNIVLIVISKVFRVLSIALPFLLLLGKKLIDKSKMETTYGSIYKNLLFFQIVLMISHSGLSSGYFRYFDSNSYEDILYLFFEAWVVIYSGLSFYLLYKHFQFEKKLKTV